MENSAFWETRLQKLQFALLEQRVGQLFEILAEDGLDPILIKGWAIARFYDNPAERSSVDIDLCFSSDIYHEAEKLLSATKYHRFNVDLHNGLRNFDSIKYEELFKHTRLITIQNYKAPVRVLRPEDHLRVLAVHWLTDGGAYFEKLKDIYYLIKNRPDDFDWDRALGIIDEKRRRWILCVIKLAHLHLQLRINDLPIYEELTDQCLIPHWMEKTLEKEWQSNLRLQPLHWNLFNLKVLWKQIKKRIPPNAIQATIEMQGDFEDSPRITYQIRSVLNRVKPSLTRINKTLWKRLSKE